MSANTFGRLLRVTTFGESHGPAIGCVIDGLPPGLPVAPEDFRADLERRALQFAQLRGGRSGRVAWQFIRDLAGELGKPLPL